ncbi:MAG: hypothetical protein QOD72_3116 [Acidimicrobiaceae bacterium]|nr:hypothetical protein [Acidimicrobiaceae bacterium]
MTASSEEGTVIGIVGNAARARVTAWGAVRFADGRHLDWWIAADDRWHVPANGAHVPQRLVEGTPVVETTIRVPSGDVQQRVYGGGGGDGLVVLELENRSRLPVAIVLSSRDVLSARAPVAVPAGAGGIDLPADAASYPLAHGSIVRLAVPFGRRPDPVVSLPTSRQVAHGWRRRVDMGPRFVVPDDALAESLVTARCRALLDEPPSFVDDPAAAVVMASERYRLREPIGLDVADIARAVGRCARARRRTPLSWTDAVMIERAGELLDAAGERRGAEDARQLLLRSSVAPLPADMPTGMPTDLWRGPWLERGLAMTNGRQIELLAGLPDAWFGQPVEVHDVPVGADRVGFALRWHGARPALLWDCSAPRRLMCSRLDASWSTDQARGEALLAPPGETAVGLRQPGRTPC